MKKSALFTLFGCLLVAFSTLSFTYSNENSEKADILLIDKRGTVISAYPTIINFKAKKNKTRIKITKTGGKAKTDVLIYYRDVYRGRIKFASGTRKETRSIVINNPPNAKIRVVFTNHSVTNTFKYRMVSHSID